jgi:hypothetical protein
MVNTRNRVTANNTENNGEIEQVLAMQAQML